MPSWIELKTHVLSNAIRNNVLGALTYYYGRDEESVRYDLLTKCSMSEADTITEGSWPKWISLDTIELIRPKAWACSGSTRPEPCWNRICFPISSWPAASSPEPRFKKTEDQPPDALS